MGLASLHPPYFLNSSRWYASRNFHLFVLAAVFLLAAFIRFWAAPISAGPDIAQFWAFADVFHEHGLDFYQYADAKDGTFPFWGWQFVYPPIWLLILGISLLAAPSSAASSQMIDESWRLAMKTPIITADLAIGALIYWAVPGSRWKKLLFAGLWLFHPTSWYESAVFGQFDAIAAAFLLASVIMLGRGKDKWAFLFAGLALMTKQHTILPIVLMLAVVSRQMSMRRFASDCAILLSVVVFFSIPFLVTGNFSSYAHSLFLPGWGPNYQEPLCYAFSGSSSFLTYLHNRYGWDTNGLMHFNTYALAATMILAIVLCRLKPITLTQGALVGMLLFIGISYQVNYQYLVVLIPLAILAAAQAVHKWERIFALGLAILPAVWFWLFDVSFWFRYLEPVHPGVQSIFEKIGWHNSSVPDWAYVAFAVTLMFSCLIYVALTFLLWSHRGQNTQPVSGSASPSGMIE